MRITEAVQLVLHAAARGRTDRIYVLRMGGQLSVLDLANNLMRLSGLVPGHDVRVEFSGVRPGEKLHESGIPRGGLGRPFVCTHRDE